MTSQPKGVHGQGFRADTSLTCLSEKKRDDGLSRLSILRDVIYVRHLTII